MCFLCILVFKLIIHFSLIKDFDFRIFDMYLNFLITKQENSITLKTEIMKALKITLILALLFVSFTSCVKQDLNEDDVLVASTENEVAQYTEGQAEDSDDD